MMNRQGNQRWARNILILLLTLTSLFTVSCATKQDEMYTGAINDFAHHRYHLSFDKTRFLAFKGNVKAQYALGYMYYYGIGIVEEHDIGFRLTAGSRRRGFFLRGLQCEFGDRQFAIGGGHCDNLFQLRSFGHGHHIAEGIADRFVSAL